MESHQFDAALRASGQILYEWDSANERLLWAGCFTDLLGWSPIDVPDVIAWAALIHEEDVASFTAERKNALESGETFRLEYRVRCRNGSEVWIQDVGRFVEPGNPRSGMAGLLLDVTSRRKVVDALQASKDDLVRRTRLGARLRRAVLALSARQSGDFDEDLHAILRSAAEALQVAHVGYWSLAEGGGSLRCELTFHSSDGSVSRGKSIAAAECPTYFAALVKNEVIAAADVALDPRTAGLEKGGKKRALLDAPVWADGTLCGIVCHEHDEGVRDWIVLEQEFALTIAQLVSVALANRERRRMEGQLRLADRMASVGTLCAGVAHEINNPLAYLLGNLSYLRESLQDGNAAPIGDLREAVADAIDGATRVRDVVRDLRLFANPDEERLGPVRVAQVIDVAQRMAMPEVRHRAQVVVDAHDVPAVLGNDSRLGQVVVNLLVNAAKAMPERPVEQNTIRIGVRSAGGRVTIEVADNGIGIPADALDRIFDPFFTTRKVGQGTGLGLFVCHSIVTAMGGEIEVESRVGVGTTFRVNLPVAPGLALAGVATPGEAPLPAVPIRRVLVIDDEPRLGTAIARMLASWSEVETVVDPHEGLRRILAEGKPYDLVLCDLMMPGMTGMELHARVEAADPSRAAGIVFITGGAVTKPAANFLREMEGRSLQKPFEAASLRSFLDGFLASRVETTGSPSCSLPTRTSTSESCA